MAENRTLYARAFEQELCVIISAEKEVRKTLIQMLNEDEVSTTALLALAKLGDFSILERVQALVESPSFLDRHVASQALAHLGIRADPFIINLLQSDKKKAL